MVAESKAADPEPVRRLGGRDRPRGGRRAAPGGRARGAREPSQDELREAPEVAVQGAVSRRSPPTRVGAADGVRTSAGNEPDGGRGPNVDGDPHRTVSAKAPGPSCFSCWVRRGDATGRAPYGTADPARLDRCGPRAVRRAQRRPGGDGALPVAPSSRAESDAMVDRIVDVDATGAGSACGRSR